jgi:hypothetical protein
MIRLISISGMEINLMDTLDLELLDMINQCWDEDAIAHQCCSDDTSSWEDDLSSWDDIPSPVPILDIQNLDPTPDIHQLFVFYDLKYFGGLLQTCGSVTWSNQIKVAAGQTIMAISPLSSQFEIELSEPILTLRPRNDLISTLLHEMIHAYQGMTGQREEQCEGHGPIFKSYAQRIGAQEGVTITIYHSFHDEVAYYRTPSHRTAQEGLRRPWAGRS